MLKTCIKSLSKWADVRLPLMTLSVFRPYAVCWDALPQIPVRFLRTCVMFPITLIQLLVASVVLTTCYFTKIVGIIYKRLSCYFPILALIYGVAALRIIDRISYILLYSVLAARTHHLFHCYQNPHDFHSGLWLS